MSRNLWSKEFLVILDVLFIGKSAGVLIIVFFMKNSALVWLLTHLLRAIYLLLLYALKHVFLLGIDENVSCIPPTSRSRIRHIVFLKSLHVLHVSTWMSDAVSSAHTEGRVTLVMFSVFIVWEHECINFSRSASLMHFFFSQSWPPSFISCVR